MLPSNATGEMAPWLWWLDDKTGRWRQMGEMKQVNNSRTKRALGGRRFYIGDIQTDKISYINIDIVWKRCYVRAQTYTMTKKGMQPVVGALVTLIGKENTDQEQYYGYTKGTTNKNGIACIPAWCDSNVVLQSSKLSFFDADGSERVSQLSPDESILEKVAPGIEASVIKGNESRSFQFTTKETSQVGPIFGGEEINKCLDLSDTLVAFRFVLNETKIKLNQLDDFGSRPPGHPLSWYTTDASNPNQEPNKCFLKIKTINFPDKPIPMVSVQSFAPDRQSRYGFSLKGQTPTGVVTDINRWDFNYSAVASACVEYRCSEIGKETHLVVTILTEYCVYPEPNPSLNSPERLPEFYGNVTTNRISPRSTLFNAPAEISDGKLGLYSGPGKIAEERCKAGTVDDVGEGNGRMNSDGYAVLAGLADFPLDCYDWFDVERPDESGPN